jgi:hypothetical protein
MRKYLIEKYNLVVVAHPDDESIFFSGLIQRQKKYPWRVICLTDGNADGKGAGRKKDFVRACQALKVADIEWWGYPDHYETRLPVNEISEYLKSLPPPQAIFTHGPLGEYGHPHHQDASYAVHKAFTDEIPIYSVAYNTLPEIRIQLTAKEYRLKTKILSEVYGSETSRFLNLLPATSTEGFIRVTHQEVQSLYQFLICSSKRKKLNTKELKIYKWLAKYLEKHKGLPRPF